MSSLDSSALRRALAAAHLLAALPTVLVVTTVLALLPEVSATTSSVKTMLQAAAVGLAASAAAHWILSRWRVREALAVDMNDAPGERLRRLLVLPQQLELFTNVPAAIVGTAAASLMLSSAVIDGPFLFGVAVLGTLAGLVSGAPFRLECQRLLENAVVEEFHRHSSIQLSGRGPFWPRKTWLLPYMSFLLLVSVAGSLFALATLKERQVLARLSAELRHQGGAAASAAADQLSGSAVQVDGAALFVAGLLLIACLMSAWLMARRERVAAEAMAESLQALARGNLRLPRYVSTNEVGEASAMTAAACTELHQLFTHLASVAEGDLHAEVIGESGLHRAFHDSQAALRRLAAQMSVLSRGDVVDQNVVPGDLGHVFDELSGALKGIIEQARTIAAGDLRRDVAVAGALGGALDRMTGNLRRMVSDMQGHGSQLSDIVVSLRNTASTLSHATTEQAAALSETVTTMTEMAHTSTTSATRAANLIQQGEATSAVVEEGRLGASRAIAAMGAISASLSRVLGASRTLAERVNKIDTIIDTVGLLADQSATLAINAGIEAARAGEAGKGFASVAREMRSLASDSRRATVQVRDILGELREKTVQVDAQVGDGARVVDDGSMQVTRLGEVVEQLGVTIEKAVGLMRQVETSARQHQQAVDEVSQALATLENASHDIRDGLLRLSALSENAHTIAHQLEGTAGTYQLAKGTKGTGTSGA